MPSTAGPLRVVGLGGTTRASSSSERALRTALRAAEQAGAEVTLLGGPVLASLPHYAPERPERSPEALELLDVIRAADGVIVASPGYHGGISGPVKNALDYLEDLREDQRPYLSGRPVGCIAAGAGWQGAVTAMSALRDVVHALRGWPTPLGVALNSAEPLFDGERCVDERASVQLAQLGEQVAKGAARLAFETGARWDASV